MKRIKLVSFIVCSLFFINAGFTQMVGGEAFLMSPGVEIGIHKNGYEGSDKLPPFPTHYRGGWVNRLGFIANPQNDGWGNYDGDFFMPGSPENRFGIEVDGVTYFNSADVGSSIPSSGLSNYQTIGKCKLVDWDGSVAGIDIRMTYKLDTTDYYYTIQVTLTNTNVVDKNDVYFYKSLDPDNNQDIGWGFATLNTIEFQPRKDCPKALVTAKDNKGWDSYFGLGGLGSNMRVARGGFYVDDASDLWNGVGAYDTTMSSSLFSDEAIGICHKDPVIAAGESSSFEFVVVMSGDQVNEALKNLIHFTYEDGPELTEFCSDTIVYKDYGGVIFESDGIPDTIYRCTEMSTLLWVEAPGEVISEYNLVWLKDGEEVGEDGYYTVLAETEEGIINVTCYLTLGECFGGGTGIMNEYVIITRQSPELVVELEVYCVDTVVLAEIVVKDAADVPGTIISYHSAHPKKYNDFDKEWLHDWVVTGDTVYVMCVDPLTNCYDVAPIIIETLSFVAGEDVMTSLCEVGTTSINLNTLLVGADEGGTWVKETPGGIFNAAEGVFDATGLPIGTYIFYYIVGEAPCPKDSAKFTITINKAPNAGLDGMAELCSAKGVTIDLNTLLSGHDGGGTWSEITGSGQFSAMGIFKADNLPAGVYRFKYRVAGIAPCAADEAIFEVVLVDLPVANFIATPVSVFTDDTEVSFTNTSLNSTHYAWNFGDGSLENFLENPIHELPAVAGTYGVKLRAMNDLGCADSVTILVYVKENVLFYIPNSFTPDGDVFNETFKPVFVAGYDPYDFHLKIYNRYGEIVFESYDASAGWDGTYGAKGLVIQGVYTWLIEFKELNTDRRQQHSGHITVLK